METAVVRVDFNSPVSNGKIIPGRRFKEHIRSLKRLSKKYRLIVLSHQGRRGKPEFMSLYQHWRIVRKNMKIKFSRDFSVPATGHVMLENVRFLDDQKKLRFLEDIADVFILDAFSVAHRSEFSVTGFRLPSIPGPVLMKEYRNLNMARTKKFMYVLGGAKVPEVVDAVSRVSGRVLLGGLAGMMLSDCRYGWGMFGKCGRDVRKMDRENVISPVDHVDGKDIGIKTTRMFLRMLRGNVLFAKPLGMYEKRKYSRGTREIYRKISQLPNIRIGGGGNTLDAIRKFRIPYRSFTYLSLSGGAFLEFVTGRKLPGLKKVGLVS